MVNRIKVVHNASYRGWRIQIRHRPELEPFPYEYVIKKGKISSTDRTSMKSLESSIKSAQSEIDHFMGRTEWWEEHLLAKEQK